MALTDLRDDLLKFGITIDIGQTVDEDIKDLNPGANLPGTVNQESDWDCRYRQIPQCQGRSLTEITPTNRIACRQIITPVCFEKTYETYWVLDFLSVLAVLPAVIMCIFEDDFSYGLCVGSYAYIFSLTHL